MATSESDRFAHRILEDVAGMKSDDLHKLTTKIVFDEMRSPTTSFVFSQEYRDRFNAELNRIAEERERIMNEPRFPSRQSLRYPWGMKRILPSQGYLFANVNRIRDNMFEDFDINRDVYTFMYSENGIHATVDVEWEQFDQARDCGFVAFARLRNHIANQLARAYDQGMIREVFNMDPNEFDRFFNRIRENGGSIEVQCEAGSRPVARIEVPADRMGMAFNMETADMKKESPEYQRKTRTIGVPKVKDVQFFNNRATIMSFTDGTTTRCVCDKEDTFQPSVGIAYCLFKRYLGGDKLGHRRFNDLMRQASEVIEANEKLKAQIAQASVNARARKAKKDETAKKRKARRRQEKMDLIADAIRKANEA